ncbi:MAG: hypothetical protein ABJQ90_18795 [Parasphingorhabdus sp.]
MFFFALIRVDASLCASDWAEAACLRLVQIGHKPLVWNSDWAQGSALAFDWADFALLIGWGRKHHLLTLSDWAQKPPVFEK